MTRELKIENRRKPFTMKSKDILIIKLNRRSGMLAMIVSLFFFLTGTAQQLQPYLTQALENNPKIQAFELRYETARERIEEVGVLPETHSELPRDSSEWSLH